MEPESQTLKQIIQTHSWTSILAVLKSTYPGDKENFHGYEHVFRLLKGMVPEKIEMVIILKTVNDGDEKYVDVSGKHKFPKSEEEKYSQGIEFLPWRQWLGMEINSESLKDFSEAETIVHCLYEMTFISFEEKEIQKKLEAIKKSVSKNKSMSTREKRENMLTFEEILKVLDHDEIGSKKKE